MLEFPIGIDSCDALGSDYVKWNSKVAKATIVFCNRTSGKLQCMYTSFVLSIFVFFQLNKLLFCLVACVLSSGQTFGETVKPLFKFTKRHTNQGHTSKVCDKTFEAAIFNALGCLKFQRALDGLLLEKCTGSAAPFNLDR